MTHRFLEIATTPAVRAAQQAQGSRRAYARQEEGALHHDRLGGSEAAFIAARDSFYMASVSETGWPYLQHRGGPAGFLRVLDETTLGFADLRGNRQYLSLGNLTVDDRVCLFLMDYGNRARLKLFGRARFHDLAAEPELARQL
uniref:pyridoxamine 5'-phosphate oxidase family protein n=1 Tax=Bosea sp. (in: a-proteobacteria) TaxID=1871050 RepID=UPI002FC94689